MNPHDVARQTEVEQEMLRQIMEGLRATAGWQVRGPDAARKLSTLQFIGHSFQRHLERLLAVEEDGGYMDLVSASAPQLGRAVDALRAEHDQFRTASRRVADRLERVSASDPAGLAEVCDELLALLRKVEAHNRKEIDLLQEAFAQDEGGEGG